MSAKLKILLADDHQIVRMGLATIIRHERDLVLCGEARNGIEAVQKARELKPDVILMDLMMPKMDGARATSEIRRECPNAKILVLTTFSASNEVRQALDAGAAGALVKDTPSAELIAAIRNIAAGKRVVSAEIEQGCHASVSTPRLSSRQQEILTYIAKGLTTKEIARTTGLSPDGVNAHLRTIFARLGAASRTEAVARALQQNLMKI